jgi:hypothetical protein
MLRLLASLVLCTATLPAVAEESLSREQIAQELVGRDIAWWDADGWRHGYLMFLPDGKAEMTVDDVDDRRTTGRWMLRGDEVCTRWEAARDGLEKCYRIERGGKGMFVTTGGNVFEVRELGV